MNLASRVATRYRVVTAFTHAQALEVLGFSAGDAPTDDEVNQAYRLRIKDIIRKNPAEAGNQVTMKPLNQAKDILIGRLEPDRDPGGRAPGGVNAEPVDFGFGGRPTAKPDPVRVTFDEAMKDAHVHQVDWKFKTSTTHGGYGDTASNGYVIYGQAGDTHVFVAVQHYRSRNAYTGEDVDVWWMVQRKATGEIRNLAPKVIRELYEDFPYDTKKYNAKVQILPEGTKLTEQLIHLSKVKSIAFKDAMVILGLVPGDDAWANRPKDIRLRILNDHPEWSVQLTINGRDHTLSPESSKALETKRILRKIFGTYYYVDSKKVLTKMQGGGKAVLKDIANALIGEPAELKQVLEAAAAG